MKKADERRKEKKKGVGHSRLISALSPSVTAPSAGSSHMNRQAIWLHYETHTHTNNTYTHSMREDAPASTNSQPYTNLNMHNRTNTDANTCREKEEECDKIASRERGRGYNGTLSCSTSGG